MTTQELKMFLKKLGVHLIEQDQNYYIFMGNNMVDFVVILKNKGESIIQAHGRITIDNTIFDELENATLKRFILNVYVAGIAKPFIKEHCHELLKQGQLT